MTRDQVFSNDEALHHIFIDTAFIIEQKIMRTGHQDAAFTGHQDTIEFRFNFGAKQTSKKHLFALLSIRLDSLQVRLREVVSLRVTRSLKFNSIFSL